MKDQQTPETKEPEAKTPYQTSSMRKWLWLMGRKKSKVKTTSSNVNDDAAHAAAEAIAQMLGDSRRHG